MPQVPLLKILIWHLIRSYQTILIQAMRIPTYLRPCCEVVNRLLFIIRKFFEVQKLCLTIIFMFSKFFLHITQTIHINYIQPSPHNNLNAHVISLKTINHNRQISHSYSHISPKSHRQMNAFIANILLEELKQDSCSICKDVLFHPHKAYKNHNLYMN